MTSGVRTTTVTVDGAVYRRRRISKSMFITTSVDDDHDEENRTEHNLIVRSRKSEPELALDVLLIQYVERKFRFRFAPGLL